MSAYKGPFVFYFYGLNDDEWLFFFMKEFQVHALLIALSGVVISFALSELLGAAVQYLAGVHWERWTSPISDKQPISVCS